jgi:glycosyltransferase involved in cell wall biosynthesis
VKFLHVISSVAPEGGGPIEGIRQLSAVLTLQGHTIEVASLDDPEADFLKGIPLKVFALGPISNKYGFCPGFVPWLREHGKDYDAVIVNGIWQYHSFAVWRALAGTSVPYFVFTHGMLDPWFKKAYPLKHLKKWLYWPLAEYRVLRDARRVLFTCEEERLLARESFWLYRAKESVTAYGVANPPPERDELAARFLAGNPQLTGKRVALFLSRIHEKKGCDLLISAFAAVAHRDDRLHLVIAGPDQTGWVVELKGLADTLGIAGRISWPGMLQGDLKWGAFYACELFCLPSHQENFGIVVAEALSCGKPVLISNKVNIWREIEEDGAGLVAADTLDGTIANFERWFAMTPEEQQIMREQTAKCFLCHFHIQRAAKRLLEIVQEGIRDTKR